jgi:hypothetical protein
MASSVFDRGSPPTQEELRCLQRVADFLAYSPDLQDVLGVDVDARVAVSESGRGLVFQFEPAGERRAR